MSRAFVTDKEDWVYCAKAGERCLHASADRDCRRTDCQYYDRAAAAPDAGPLGSQQGVKIVRRESKKQPAGTGAPSKNAPAKSVPSKNAPGKNAPSKNAPGTPGAGTPGAGARPTKRANIKPPRRWGGRSG